MPGCRSEAAHARPTAGKRPEPAAVAAWVYSYGSAGPRACAGLDTGAIARPNANIGSGFGSGAAAGHGVQAACRLQSLLLADRRAEHARFPLL
jgi:hypothetical protein